MWPISMFFSSKPIAVRVDNEFSRHGIKLSALNKYIELYMSNGLHHFTVTVLKLKMKKVKT